MTFDQSQNESSHAEALPGDEVGRRTRREPKLSVASGVANLQRFSAERVEQPVSEGRSSGPSGALAQLTPCSRRRGSPSRFPSLGGRRG